MCYKIFIDGREGTTGLQIHHYFKKRSDLHLLDITEDKRKDLDERLRLMKEADIIFLCLPDEASKEIIKYADPNWRILDTSTAHRTDPNWTYGLPELEGDQRQRIKIANRVAIPGCHATGFILLVKPLIEIGITDACYPFNCHSITGYSGGRKKMIAAYERQSAADLKNTMLSPRQYGLTQQHKHLQEMVAMTGIKSTPIFNPIVADFYSGMMVSVPLRRELLEKRISLKQLKEQFVSYYHGECMIQVNDEAESAEAGFLSANALSGKNSTEILLYGNDDRMMLAARYDNLGKGASGAAVQCMNIMLGIEETTGLI